MGRGLVGPAGPTLRDATANSRNGRSNGFHVQLQQRDPFPTFSCKMVALTSAVWPKVRLFLDEPGINQTAGVGRGVGFGRGVVFRPALVTGCLGVNGFLPVSMLEENSETDEAGAPNKVVRMSLDLGDHPARLAKLKVKRHAGRGTSSAGAVADGRRRRRAAGRRAPRSRTMSIS